MTDPDLSFPPASEADWNKGNGLIPVIVQEWLSLRVLMLGYVNREAYEITSKTRLMSFYSRSKNRLWQKGETSGNFLRVKHISIDCDGDSFLIKAIPEGPTCHKGTMSCFGVDEGPSFSILSHLKNIIRERHKNPADGSYTSDLFKSGIIRIAQKVGEEGLETALAAATRSENTKDEAADLIYHLLVLLEATATPIDDVLRVLEARALGQLKT